jgi:hypothetical protein
MLGVNVSPREFWHSGFVERTLATLEKTGLDPSLLCIEITENTMMRDTDQAARRAQQLREHGILVAIDDFGTGYSSLSYLREFPIDVLKIDQAFISTLAEDDQQLGLVQAIISMARALHLVVVAEDGAGRYRLLALLAGGSAVGVGAATAGVTAQESPTPNPVQLGTQSTPSPDSSSLDIEGDQVRVEASPSPLDDILDSVNTAGSADSPGTESPDADTAGTGSAQSVDSPDTADTGDNDSPDVDNSGPGSQSSGPGNADSADSPDSDNSGPGSDNSGSGDGDDNSGSGS